MTVPGVHILTSSFFFHWLQPVCLRSIACLPLFFPSYVEVVLPGGYPGLRIAKVKNDMDLTCLLLSQKGVSIPKAPNPYSLVPTGRAK